MISIITTTIRKDPRFKETADSLARMTDQNVPWSWLVVDGQLWYEPGRRAALSEAVGGRFNFKHIEPKPTVWQGPTRLTSRDHWDACSARNTGIAAAEYPYVVFIDDCMEVAPEWFGYVVEAALHRRVYAGTYVSTLAGAPIISGEDHRKELCPDAQFVGGGWLYGMNMGVPLEAALKVNGYDELYSGAGGVEDCDFGMRLARAGAPTWWEPGAVVFQLMGTHEPVCSHTGGAALAAGHQLTGAPKNRTLKSGEVRYANEFLTEKLLTEDTGRYRPLWKHVNLRALRAAYWAGEPFPVPTKPTYDWRDGQPLGEM